MSYAVWQPVCVTQVAMSFGTQKLWRGGYRATETSMALLNKDIRYPKVDTKSLIAK